MISASTALLAFAGAGFADPPDTLVSPPNHRHFVVTVTGPVPVGPQICTNANLQQAFNEFLDFADRPASADADTRDLQSAAAAPSLL